MPRFPLTPPFAKLEGNCWHARLPDEFAEGGDNSTWPRRSCWALLEDDAPLGEPHAVHKEIERHGAGRFSHWSSTLYFSTSDNSDPNTNGRSYVLEWRGKANDPRPAPFWQREKRLAPARHDTEVTRCKAIIAVLGASFSGSTLVSLVFGGHPEIFGGSELHRLVQTPELAVCSVCGQNCSFWTDELRQQLTIAGFYDRISQAAGKAIICDSSKKPAWFREVMPHFADRLSATLLLVKHPLRHAASYVEKAEHNRRAGLASQSADVDEILRAVRCVYEEVEIADEPPFTRAYTHRPPEFRCDFLMRYEDFVADPAKSMAPIFARVGTPIHADIAAWVSADNHPVGGNIGPIVQIRGAVPALPTAQRKYRQTGIFLDDFYKEILTLRQMRAVLDSPDARWMMKRFGYED